MFIEHCIQYSTGVERRETIKVEARRLGRGRDLTCSQA